MKNFGGGPTWLPGVVQDRTGPVSYRVQMGDGRVFRDMWTTYATDRRGRRRAGVRHSRRVPAQRELTPPQQQNEETRGREQPPNARDGSETVAAEAGGRDVEEESRGPDIGTEEPHRSTRIRADLLKLCGEKCGVFPVRRLSHSVHNPP